MKKDFSTKIVGAVNFSALVLTVGLVMGAILPGKVVVGIGAVVCLICVVIFHYRHQISDWSQKELDDQDFENRA